MLISVFMGSDGLNFLKQEGWGIFDEFICVKVVSKLFIVLFCI